MALLTISEVGRRVGLNSSAIRYYEQLGILPPAVRINRQRRYDKSMLYRLAVLQRARQAGFALDEIRTLFFGFQDGTRADARWNKLADRKLAELETIAGQIKSMQNLLKRLKARCHCTTLDVCGRAILDGGIGKVASPGLAAWRETPVQKRVLRKMRDKTRVNTG